LPNEGNQSSPGGEMDNDQMEGLLEGMGMEGMEGMEAMEAAMENDDPKQSDGPNINTS